MQEAFQKKTGFRRERLYFLPIGGTAMATLAGLLHSAGHQVEGVDSTLYPPMSTLLEELEIPVRIGWNPTVIPAVDRVIIGNAAHRDNPEVQRVLSEGIPHLAQAEAVAHYLLAEGRRALLVAGTHGKTTTTSLLAWVFESVGADPTSFVGGLLRWSRRSFRLGRGPWMIIEADEYNTAFFDQGPKFFHYRPEIFAIGPVEFDHADLYRDFGAVLTAFRAGTAQVPRHGRIVASWDHEGTRAALRDARADILRIGWGRECDVRFLEQEWTGVENRSVVEFEGRRLEMTIPLPGRYNAENAALALGAAVSAGLNPEAVLSALSTFPGVARRLDLRYETGNILLVDDFAHHPTALGVTIDAARQRWPGRRLVAVFEPRSLTAARKDFLPAYVEALGRAEIALVVAPYHRRRIAVEDMFDREELADQLRSRGTEALMPETEEDPVGYLLPHLRPGDLVLVCSSGDFGGFLTRLKEALDDRGDR